MYRVYLGDILLPVAPEKISIFQGGESRSASLLGLGEISFPVMPDLKKISFEAIFPYQKYPFAAYEDDVYYLPWRYAFLLNAMKEAKKPVYFKVIRVKDNFKGLLYDENIKVTVESLYFKESAEEGLDLKVDIVLKEYRDFVTKKYTIDEKGELFLENSRSCEKEIPSQQNPEMYTVKSGDTLWDICKSVYGNGEKYKEVAVYNGIVNPNKIYNGQVIKLV